jgi:hypothetical protein
MIVRPTLRVLSLIPVLSLALACGGGGGGPDAFVPEDLVDDDAVGEDSGNDVKDVVQLDDGVVIKDDNSGDVKPGDGVVEDRIEPDTQQVDTGSETTEVNLCPCPVPVAGQPATDVCLITDLPKHLKVEYTSDICAKCAQCANGPECKGCTGTRTDCVDLPAPNYVSWKGKCDNCDWCATETECLEQDYKVCGKVCASKGGVATEYADLCKMKGDFGCFPDYYGSIDNFGACPAASCDACILEPSNPVCGKDGKTYRNDCSRIQCSGSPAVERDYLGACLGVNFCSTCKDAGHSAVCGSDGITYANECAATTCAIGDKTVAHVGPCCPECGNLGPEECAADGKVYKNVCAAACAKVAPCGSGGPVVCGKDGQDQPNACWANCKSGGTLHEGECVGVCEQCDKTYAPICGVGSNGLPRSFQNTCFRDCLGGTGSTPGLCTKCTTDCQNATPATVCGDDGITYPNSCIPRSCMMLPNPTAGACPL